MILRIYIWYIYDTAKIPPLYISRHTPAYIYIYKELLLLLAREGGGGVPAAGTLANSASNAAAARSSSSPAPL